MILRSSAAKLRFIDPAKVAGVGQTQEAAILVALGRVDQVEVAGVGQAEEAAMLVALGGLLSSRRGPGRGGQHARRPWPR